jgi:hypothetical protein
MQARWLRSVGMTVLVLGVSFAPAMSHAQSSGKPVAADFKGAVGLGLIGAELGAVIPALAGLDAAWGYIVFPVIGAAGGAVGGYFALDHAGHAQLSVVALTAGMALVIPALVATLSLTAYNPTSDSETQRAGSSGLASVQAARRAKLAARAASGTGMLRVSEGELALAAPGVAIVPTTDKGELRVAGVSVSLLSGRF